MVSFIIIDFMGDLYFSVRLGKLVWLRDMFGWKDLLGWGWMMGWFCGFGGGGGCWCIICVFFVEKFIGFLLLILLFLFELLL